jgi:hypothetical protein
LFAAGRRLRRWLRLECPLCRGNRSCQECGGLGDVICDACGGAGADCADCQQCHGEGRYVCRPCDGGGACPRCKGQGEIQES